jgi:hypothetical protein
VFIGLRTNYSATPVEIARQLEPMGFEPCGTELSQYNGGQNNSKVRYLTARFRVDDDGNEDKA